MDLHGVVRPDWYHQGPVQGRLCTSYHPIPSARPKAYPRVQQIVKTGRFESVRLRKCQKPFFAHFEQNWKVSESKSVRIWKCQNSDTFQSEPFLTLSNLSNFWHFTIRAVSDTFQSEQFLTLSNSSNFWHFPIWTASDTFQSEQVLTLSNPISFWHFPIFSNSDTFWHFPILTLSNSDTFRFWYFPIWHKNGFWHFPILTLSSLSKNHLLACVLRVAGSSPGRVQLPQHLPTAFLTVQPLQDWPRRSIASYHPK